MDRMLRTYVTDHSTYFWSGAALAIGGLALYYVAKGGRRTWYRSDDDGDRDCDRRNDSPFFEGNLVQALKMHGEGSALIVVLEDDAMGSRRLREHVWTDRLTLSLLRKHGANAKSSSTLDRVRDDHRDRKDKPLIVIRVRQDSDDGKFMRQLVSGPDRSPPENPLVFLFRYGHVRTFSLNLLVNSSRSDTIAGIRNLQISVRRILGRFLGRGRGASVGPVEDSSKESGLRKQRAYAENLRRMRGNWTVAILVSSGRFDARDVVPDRRSTTTTRQRRHPPIASEEKKNVPSIRKQQDAAFAASLKRDREASKRKRDEQEAAELRAAIELSAKLARETKLRRLKERIPEEPNVDSSEEPIVEILFIIQTATGLKRMKRCFLQTSTMKDVFNYLDVETASLDLVEYSVASNFPLRNFSHNDEKTNSLTLKTLGITGRIALNVRDLRR